MLWERVSSTSSCCQNIGSTFSDAQTFTKVDANVGFWQIPLSKELCYLTAFITLFGKYLLNTLPSGITSAPELLDIKLFFDRIDAAGLTLHGSKCNIGMYQVNTLAMYSPLMEWNLIL